MQPSFKLQKRAGTPSGRGPVLFCGLGLVAILTIYSFFQPGLLDTANNRIYDVLLRSLKHKAPSDLPVIVDIDDESLSHLGQWPWPRYRVAQLLEMINTFGPRSVALDIIFPEPDRTSINQIRGQIERDFNVQLKIQDATGSLSEVLTDNDAQLSETLSTGPFVLGYKFFFDGEPAGLSDCQLHPAPVFVSRSKGSPNDQPPLLAPQGSICNISKLSRSVTHSGFIDAVTDRDGALRRVPLLMFYNGRFYPSLALASVLKAFGTDQIVLRTHSGMIESATLGVYTVPLDEKGNLLIRFRGPQNTYRHISAARIFAGEDLEKEINGRIVFIGTSATGLRDFHATLYDPLYPGMEAHAAIVDSIIQGDPVKRSQWMRGIELIMGLLVGILSAFLIAYSRGAWSIVVFILCIAGLWLGSGWLLDSRRIFISPFIPISIFGVNFSFLSALKFWREERHGKKRAEELAMVQAVTLETIAMVIETRHTETGGHVKRTQHYVKHLAEYLQKNKKYRSWLDDETIELLFQSSPLHDVGKVGVPDAVLKNPGKLKIEDFEVMKQHTVYGKLIFDEAEAKLGHNSFLSIARTIAHTHHEKWDGFGYPQGLKGEDIPLVGRIMAIADVYDALISKRVYKPAMTHEDAVAIIEAGIGKEFDPVVVDAFLKCQNKFREVANRFTDGI